MKRSSTTVIATALSLALAGGALAGCSGQQAAPASEQEATTTQEASTTEEAQPAAQTPEEVLAEFKSAMANLPKCTSVTIQEKTSTVTKSDQESIDSESVYKFDESGAQPKASASHATDIISLKYIVDGDQAVCVTDGPVYGGTVEQFDIQYVNLHDYLESYIGEKGVLVECATAAEKQELGGITLYKLTIDVDKLIEADEALKMLADYGSPVQAVTYNIGFDADGRISSIDKAYDYADLTATWALVFSDYDSTVVEDMPEATNTFEEMEADIQMKFDEIFGDELLEETGEAATGESNETVEETE